MRQLRELFPHSQTHQHRERSPTAEVLKARPHPRRVPARVDPKARNIKQQQRLRIQSSSTSSESSSTRPFIRTHQSTCLPRKQLLLRRKRRPLPPQLMPRTKVSVLRLICPPNAVASTWAIFYHGREPLLTRICRYDQGGHPYCESTKLRAFVDVARRQSPLASCDRPCRFHHNVSTYSYKHWKLTRRCHI